MAIQNPVIFLPGIQGSTLRDSYPVDPDTIWSVLRRDELRAALHPDDLRYELLEPARVDADAVFKLIYGDLIDELRAELSSPGKPTPVFPFPYDWRMPLEVSVDRLEAFVDEVIGRTSLLRHYFKGGYADAPKVDLIAHSMGGLVAAGYLAKAGADSRVGRVITIATPFRGSLEAPVKAVTGTADLGEESSNPRDRFAARLTPALYHLLPSFKGAVLTEDGIPDNLFDTAAWQPSIYGSIAEAYQLHGKDPGASLAKRLEDAQVLVGEMLTQARSYLDGVEGLTLEGCGLAPDDWLCIAGVDSETRVQMTIRKERDRPHFDLASSDRMNRWDSVDPEVKARTGDGTVPFHGAQSSFIPLEKIICLRPADFGYWEVRDRLLRRVAGFHAGLPTMNLVHRLVAAFLLGEHSRKGMWGWRAPGVAAGEWDPPIRGLRERE